VHSEEAEIATIFYVTQHTDDKGRCCCGLTLALNA